MSPPRTAACANAWLSCRRAAAPYCKHLTPPNSSCNAIARGIVLGSTCVASESGEWHQGFGWNKDFPRFPQSLPREGTTQPRAARPGSVRGRSLSGALRTGGSAQSGAKEPRVGGRCRVGEGQLGGSWLNFDPAAARGGSRRRPARVGCRGARLCAARLRGCLFNQEHRRGGP